MQCSSCCALNTNVGPFNTEYSFAVDILSEKKKSSFFPGYWIEPVSSNFLPLHRPEWHYIMLAYRILLPIILATITNYVSGMGFSLNVQNTHLTHIKKNHTALCWGSFAKYTLTMDNAAAQTVKTKHNVYFVCCTCVVPTFSSLYTGCPTS